MVPLIELLSLVFAALVFVVGISQVVMPLLRNQRVFPAFRRVGKLQEELGEAQENIEVAKLEKEVGRKRRQATRITPNAG